MMTIQTDIKSRVISVIEKCTGLSSEQLAPCHWQEPLTGRIFNLFAVDLIYILFEIEKEFSIQIPPDALSQYQFNSIDSICLAVKENLGHT